MPPETLPPDFFDDIKPGNSEFDDPGNPESEDWDTSHSALGKFLQHIEWADSKGNKFEFGVDLFIDILPKWLYSEEDRRADADEDAVVIVLQNESIGLPGSTERFEHKVDSGIVANIYAGNSDRASQEASRLYQFLLRREIQFTTRTFHMLQVRVVSEPSLVGVEDSGWVNYALRLVTRGIRPYRR